MSQNNLESLRQAQRQSPIAILVILQKLFRTLIRSAWPLLVIYFINPEKRFELYLAVIGIGVVFISSVSSLTSYFTFYFYLNDEELIIRKGLFNKVNRNIPYDRIQTINFKQTIIHQFFNVVSLEIDTAGSKGNEFSIKALSREKADAIQSFILSRKKETTPIVEGDFDSTLPIDAAPEFEEKQLLHLSVSDLLKIGFSQNHLRTVGVIIVFFFGLSDYIEDFFGKDYYQEMTKFLGSSFQILASLFVLFLFASLIVSLVRTVLQYYDFVFLKTAQGFKIKSGLFTRNEQSAQIQKIQMVQWTSNPIKRHFNLFTLYLRQAASTSINKNQVIYVPGCYEEQVKTVRQTYFPEEEQTSFTRHKISPLVIGRQVLYFGVLPTVILILLSLSSGWQALLWLLLIPAVYFYSAYYHRKWYYELSEEGLRTSKGVIGQNAALLQWYKIQSVNIKQTIYQRRKNLADVHFHTAGGSIELPYIELDKAHALMDYVLYRIEIDERRWM